MGYTGQRPSAIPLDSSDIADGTITNDDLAGSITSAKITSLDATKLTGTVADARISASSVNAHVSLTAVRQDIAMLALYNAVSDNRAAYNLPNSFIDQFEDDTGTTTRTNVTNVDEYFASVYLVSGKFVSDSQTSLLIHSDTTGGSSTFTDSSSHGHTISTQGTITHSTGVTPKIGATSLALNGSNGIKVPWHASLQFDADYTIEFWVYAPGTLSATGRLASHWPNHHYNNGGQWFIRPNTDGSDSITMEHSGSGGGSFSTTGEYINTNAWNHVAMMRHGSNCVLYVNGTSRLSTGCSTNTTGSVQDITFGFYNPPSPTEFVPTGYYLDEIRISKGIARYTSSFTPSEDSGTASATGSLISDTQTATGTVTKMSGVILYKDNGSGASTLGTHLQIWFSANGGTNWTQATSYGAVTPLFSAGVKMVRLGETTLSHSGTAPVMKAVWASQASGTLETQLHGWAMNY